MKKLFSLFLFCAVSFLFSQNRFVYQLKFKIDSTKKENVLTENFNLDVNEHGSFFYSAAYAENDSIMAANNISGQDQKIKVEPQLDYLIRKNYKTKDVTFDELLGLDNFEVTETHKMDWVILNEFKFLAHYKVQEAKTTFGGRDWICWFTQEIPLSDGPYKFSGLPGLILEAYDSKDDYHFSLIKTTKPTTIFVDKFNSTFGIRTIKVSYDEYLKKRGQIDEDPSIVLKQMPGVDRLSGEELQDVEKDFVTSYRNKQKIRNNKIELSKFRIFKLK